MSKHIKTDELSAYLDGEAENSKTVEYHLDTCEACSDKLESMRSLSNQFQNFSEPEIHPAFAQRVLASIAEEKSTQERSGILRWVYGMSPIAVLALLLVTITLNTPENPPRSADEATATDTTALMVTILQQDEADLFDQLSEKLAKDGTETSIVATAYQGTTLDSSSVDTTTLAFALSETKNRAQVDNQWPDSHDVRTTVNHLNAQESDLFRQMLIVHAQETLLGKASFEG
jgi:predicted anti-sigma-YlaC factor YlaD